jgi:transcription elongation factor Elf1
MTYQFQDWFACPECGERDRVSTLAHRTDIVFECYECSQTSEFVIGEDISLRNLDIDAIEDLIDDQTTD